VLLGVGGPDLPDARRAEGDVLEDRLVREEVERLEDHADIGPELRELLAVLGKRLAVDADRAAVDRLEPVDGAAQRGLAAARRTDHDHDLAAMDREIDVLQNVQFTEVLVDVLEYDEWSAAAPVGRRGRLAAVGHARKAYVIQRTQPVI
jgi:hypothetical protein